MSWPHSSLPTSEMFTVWGLLSLFQTDSQRAVYSSLSMPSGVEGTDRQIHPHIPRGAQQSKLVTMYPSRWLLPVEEGPALGKVPLMKLGCVPSINSRATTTGLSGINVHGSKSLARMGVSVVPSCHM